MVDVYLQILMFVSKLVQQALQCNQPNWRLKHGCPACTYVLQDEPPMRFKLLFSQDGNDSLKRVATKVLDGDLDDTVPLAASLSASECTYLHEQYLTHEFVKRFTSDQWAAHSIFDEVRISYFHIRFPDSDRRIRWWWEPLCRALEEYEGQCNTKDVEHIWWIRCLHCGLQAWFLLAHCRHGTKRWTVSRLLQWLFLQTNMLVHRSKYALSVTSKLLDTFGSDLGGGYDIGCRFKTTLASSILGKRAWSLNYTSLVNAFHGHAHNRLCQLDNLTMYVEGLGLEDLKGCEWTFSKSNTLASSVQYASIFHRRQAIASYFEYNDEMEVYTNLSK